MHISCVGRGEICQGTAGTFTFPETQICYSVSFYHQLGNVARALSMTNELLELVPTHERALGNRAYYQKEIQSKASQTKKKRGEDGQDDTAIPEQVRSIERDANLAKLDIENVYDVVLYLQMQIYTEMHFIISHRTCM